MNSGPVRRIVVAVEDDATARAALEWAGRRAARLGARVELVHVLRSPGRLSRRLGTYSVAGVQDAGRVALDGLRHGVVHVRRGAVHPVVTSTGVLRGELARTVARAATGADVLVLGGSLTLRPGGIDRSPGVASRVTGRATCPVVVVARTAPSTGRGVVVGDDGNPWTTAALEFAADEAVRSGEPLLVVRARAAAAEAAAGPEPGPLDERRWEEREMEAVVLRLRARRPTLSVRWRLAHDPEAARALQDAARGAAVLVVGVRRRHGFGRWSGSTPRRLLTMPDGGTPLVVVPPRSRRHR